MRVPMLRWKMILALLMLLAQTQATTIKEERYDTVNNKNLL
jgi:hypothetical protein